MHFCFFLGAKLSYDIVSISDLCLRDLKYQNRKRTEGFIIATRQNLVVYMYIKKKINVE